MQDLHVLREGNRQHPEGKLHPSHTLASVSKTAKNCPIKFIINDVFHLCAGAMKQINRTYQSIAFTTAKRSFVRYRKQLLIILGAIYTIDLNRLRRYRALEFRQPVTQGKHSVKRSLYKALHKRLSLPGAT